MTSVQVFDPRFATIAASAAPATCLCTGAVWSEGPVWLDETQELLWSDIPTNRILSWQRGVGMRVWREQADFTNGHVLERDGALLHCSHGQRAIIRTRFDGTGNSITDEVVVSQYQGRKLNSPNDLVVKSDGTIWFTDPPYGILSDREGHKADRELGGHYVFRFDPSSQSLRIVSDFLQEPNGLAFSPDESVLYVTDTSAAMRSDGTGHHHIVAFDVLNGQDLSRPRIFAVIEPGLPDGIRMDCHGHLYSSSGSGVQVYHPDGTRIGHIEIPERVGNLCFGGAEGNELFICASTSVYHVVLNTRGATA